MTFPEPPARAERQARRRRAQVTATAVAAALTLVASAGLTAPSALAVDTATSRTVITPSSRVAALIARMTLDEKLSFVSGSVDPQPTGAAGFVPGVPRLGIPPLRLTDGPNGIRLNTGATAFPAPVALASSFDDRLARAYGQELGREGRALGQDVLLSPMTNIIRVPQAGRNFETFSEDPLLSSRMVSEEVKGIQGQGLIATVKHYALNNQETDRTTVDVRADEQTMREVELPAYQAAVDAGAGAVMCAHNKVNGAHSCGSDELLNTILKEQWGFQGWVVSDWGAAHSAHDIEAGLDQSMFAAGLQESPYFSRDLKAAIQAGTIPESALTDAVARILGQMERFGLLDGAAATRPPRDRKGAAEVARRVAESGAVLLKNDDGALPLGTEDDSLALIGTPAKTPKVTGGGSANVVPESAASPLDTITRRAGKRTTVRYEAGTAPGTAIPAASLSPAPPFDRDGTVKVTTDSTFTYTASLSVPAEGDYTFRLDAANGYGSLGVDGKNATVSVLGSTTATVHLTAGTHTLSLFGLAANGAEFPLSLTWVTPAAAAEARDRAVALARKVRTPVVFVQDEGTEDKDRAGLGLAGGQDELISAVADANPHTVVVLNTGSSITMPWLPKVDAVLDMYYPGQEGAAATARLLYGDVNPSGKLTQTFPTSEKVTPVAGDPQAFPGTSGTETYSEGIHVGYKWYDKQGAEPLFDFGHGLSYTSFSYRDIAVKQRKGGLSVSFTLTNTGRRAGQEVAQVYAGPSRNIDAPQAVRKLVGYEKVRLAPGQSRRVTVTVDARTLSSWDTDRGRWVLGTGPRDIRVGGSSDALPLRARTVVTR